MHDAVMHTSERRCAPLVPNAATIEAMREARRGNLPQFDTVEALFDDLHVDDFERTSRFKHHDHAPSGE